MNITAHSLFGVEYVCVLRLRKLATKFDLNKFSLDTIGNLTCSTLSLVVNDYLNLESYEVTLLIIVFKNPQPLGLKKF